MTPSRTSTCKSSSTGRSEHNWTCEVWVMGSIRCCVHNPLSMLQANRGNDFLVQFKSCHLVGVVGINRALDNPFEQGKLGPCNRLRCQMRTFHWVGDVSPRTIHHAKTCQRTLEWGWRVARENRGGKVQDATAGPLGELGSGSEDLKSGMCAGKGYHGFR